MLRPGRVTSHDRRDDARIADDTTTGSASYYERAFAVDVDPEHIEPGSWRHAQPHVRRRLHPARGGPHLQPGRRARPTGRRPTGFAGQDTRISPFFACVVLRRHDHGQAGRTRPRRPAGQLRARRQPSHHRPWCPQRRGTGPGDHVELILAHVLHTEALRILLPVATALVEERMASFAAALMAGVAAKYGGDPDHLAVVTATMPDQETGRRRRFLVLHDTLPRGTGYLHRLADQDEFREVLVSARERRRRTARARTRASAPATAACSATSATTSSTWSPAPRRCPCWTTCSSDWATTAVASTREISLLGPGGKRAGGPVREGAQGLGGRLSPPSR